jgi:hypothetical protein
VVECSASQSAGHARELEQHFDLDAREWSLDRAGEPPAATVLSSFFHYNDVRRRWPHRLADVHFVTIRPVPELAEHVARARTSRSAKLLVLERDGETAAIVAADVSLLLPR